ncbi:MAG: PilC/PilY family type IV pilus protein [Gammaproteobacteria bacterium]|nr:PilC/PilY family type IV pilus protein [Gammaproteobacteria bacterium]
MKNMCRQLQKISTGFVLGCFMAAPVFADDIEIYTDANLIGALAQPNVMFIMDSSDSMTSTLPASEPYDYTKTYDLAGGYDPNFIYYSEDGSIPATNGDYVFWSANNCDHAVKDYVAGVAGAANTGPLYTVGIYSGQIGHFNAASNKLVWGPIKATNDTARAYPIECLQDHGIHGSNSGGAKYIGNKPDTSTGWVAAENKSVAAALWANNANNYTLFAGNYLNYLVDPTVIVSQVPLFDQLKNAIATIVASASNINIGLMQYDSKINIIDGVDHGGEGGAVMYPALDVNLGRQDFYSRLKTMNTGIDPVIAETYFEALQYFGGKEIVYGDDALPSNQTGTKENGNPTHYETPITETCQKNYIIVVSNGLSRYDYLGDDKRSRLDGFDIGQCNTAAYAPGITNLDAFDSDGSTVDNCLDEMAGWALTNDVATREFDAHEGDQNITTYTVGFAFPTIASQELLDGEQLLRDTAEKGGGRFVAADDETDLVRVLNELLAEILKVNSTFSSPAVSVNAFNRATNLEDLYFTLFKPADGEHWEGNLKKFKLEFDADNLPYVADVNHNLAIDAATGFFKDSSESYWTQAADSPDGAETAKGGAAGNLTTLRKMYTYTGSYSGSTGVLTPSNGDLTSASNALRWFSTDITDAMLGGVAAKPDVPLYFGTFTASIDYLNGLLLWASGTDVKDIDDDAWSFEARREMGDPLHAEPALVQYGLTAGGEPDLVAYVATNDGYLHAFDSITGKENFAFVPQEMLPKLQNIFDDTGINGKAYGLDGNVIAWINDTDDDGTISGAGEHVYLYFGMRRGGRYIYSMDVTNRNSPKLRWVIEGGTGDYAELGQTWSAPNIERIIMGGSERTVLIFGAGYDTNQDYLTTRGVDSVGRGIMIADADTGELLWRAGPDGSAKLQLNDMKYSIPARIKPIDIDGDGAVDRLFAGDMGGQLWRIDIDNEASTATSISATGGRIADLAIDGSINDNRRFYNSPDVAMIIESGRAPYLSIIAASGYRAHPLQTDTHDRAYMIRDYDVYTTPASYATVTENDLFDTTDNKIGEGSLIDVVAAKDSLGTASGWYITFNEMDGSFVGEKALSEPLILNGVAVFTTFIPAEAGLTSNSCKANDGTGAIYFVNVVDGTPTNDNTGNNIKTREDRRVLLARGGIPPTPRIIITAQGVPTLCVGTECSKASDVGTVQKMYWYEVE